MSMFKSIFSVYSQRQSTHQSCQWLDYIVLFFLVVTALRKHAYSNILKFSPSKTENFQKKKVSDIFQISAQNIDCEYTLEPPRRGGSNEYPQFMFLRRNKKKYCIPL